MLFSDRIVIIREKLFNINYFMQFFICKNIQI